MDDPFLERIQMQVLDFATDKRSQWEKIINCIPLYLSLRQSAILTAFIAICTTIMHQTSYHLTK